MSKRPRKWHQNLEEFLDLIPRHFTKQLITNILLGPPRHQTRGHIVQRMVEFTQMSEARLDSSDRSERIAQELIFLATYAVLASRYITECSAIEVEKLVRDWYYEPNLKPRTILDRYNGMKWIGQVCTGLFPEWNRLCHDIFICK